MRGEEDHMKSDSVTLNLNDFEQRLMVNGLVTFRNGLISDARPTEDVEDLILKVIRSGIIDKMGSSDSLIEQFRIPMGDAEEGTKTWSYDNDSGKIFMSRKNGNFQKNIEGLHEFIYGKYYPANP
jgi:hypothetical protein